MHSISYHYRREAVIADIIRAENEDTTTNLADLFTKLSGESERGFYLIFLCIKSKVARCYFWLEWFLSIILCVGDLEKWKVVIFDWNGFSHDRYMLMIVALNFMVKIKKFKDNNFGGTD